MNRTKVKTVNFGDPALNGGLATVGYRLNGGARVTAGITEVLAGSGCYQATITFPPNFKGVLLWDNGVIGGGLRYAPEDINPDESYLAPDGLAPVQIEGLYSLPQVIGLMAAAVVSLVSGMDSNTPQFTALGTGPGGPIRASFETDESGNRLSCVLTPEA